MQFPGPKGDEEARGLGLGAGMRVGGDARGRRELHLDRPRP